MSVCGMSVNLTAGLALMTVAEESADRGFMADEAAVCDEITAALCASDSSLSASFSRSALSLCRQS